MHGEKPTADRGLLHSDSEAYLDLLGHLIEKSPYGRVLRKYEQQIGRIVAENPQIKQTLSRLCEGNAVTGVQRKSFHNTRENDLCIINCFLEFIYFATDEVIQELSGEKRTAV